MSSYQTLFSNYTTHQTQLYFPNITHIKIPKVSKCCFIHRPFQSLQNNPSPNCKHFTSKIRTQVHMQSEAVFGAAVQEKTREKKLGKMTTFDDRDMALIGLESLKQANLSLEDFYRTYYMLHGLDVTKPECIFKYLPLFSYVYGYVFKLDILNEKVVDAMRGKTAVGDQRSIIEDDYCLNLEKSLKFLESDPFEPLMLQLERSGLLTQRIRQEFKEGVDYMAFERKMCIPTEPVPTSIEEVMTAIDYKAYDYRAVNLLLYQLEGKEINELHMEFLSVSHFLAEISSDLYDYKDDVMNNTFNTLRLFVNVYGPSDAPTMLARCIADKEEKYKELGKALDPEVFKKIQMRWVEAAKIGYKMSGYPLGSWTIPTVIADEDAYRSSNQNCP